MVFETLVAGVLNKFLGDYVDNFDSSKLKLSIWGGDVTLTDLHFKESALDDLDLPVKIGSGQLGKLILSIPYKSLYTSPTKVTIRDLYVLVLPNQGIKYDKDKEAKAAEASKQAELQRIEEAKTKLSEKSDTKEDKKDTFTEKLITQIIKNLQVKIIDIHIRYEDRFSDPQNPFSVGFTLHNLFFETTDETWATKVIQENVSIIHKLVTLDSLGIYWNSKSALCSALSKEERKDFMGNGIASSTYIPNDNKYMLGPINSYAKLRLNPKPEADGSGFKIPKVWLNVDMQEIAIGLSRLQYRDLMTLLESLDRMTVASLYRKYRPDVPKLGHATEWWKFAMTAILEEDIRRKKRNWSWEHMKQHLNKCKKYKELYVIKLLGKKFTKEVEAEICDFEKELDLFNITVVRKQAELEALRSPKDKEKETQTWGGWFGSFFSKPNTKENADESAGTKLVRQIEEEMTKEEKQKLYEAIGYQEQIPVTDYPKEFVENNMSFLLHKLTLTLSDDTRSELIVLKAHLKEVFASVEQRPAAQAICVCTKIDSFIVDGVPSEKKLAPTIVTSRQNIKSRKALLDITFEINPLDESCDQRLNIEAQPLEITYDAITVNNLAEVFKPPETIALQQLQATAMIKLEGIKEMSALGLQYAIEQHKYLDLNVDVQPVFLIVPEKGVRNEESQLIVVSLGNFKMKSLKRDPESPTIKTLVKAGSTEEEVMSTMIDKAYDKFEISVANIEVLLAAPGEDWKSRIGSKGDSSHVLYPVTVNVKFHKSIITVDPRMPKMKISGELPSLDLGISDYQLKQILKIAASIPLPQSDTVTEKESEPVYPQHLSSAVAADFVNTKAVQQIKKEAVENYKSFSCDVPDEEEIEVKESSVQSTEIEFTFEIKQFGLIFSRRVENTDIKMLKFAFDHFGTDFTKRTYDMSANVYLGGLSLEHLECQTCTGEVLKILSTAVNESEENLFSLNYANVDKKAPDFTTVYDSTIQKVTIHFKEIDIVLHQEGILSIMDLSNSILASIDASGSQHQSIPAPSVESTTTRKKSEVDDKARSKSVSRKKKTDAEREKIIDTKLDATLESIKLKVCNKKYDLTDIWIKGMNSLIEVQKSKMSILASLKDVIVSDPTPQALYPQIISTVAGEVLDVKLFIFNDATDDENYADMSAVDMRIAVIFGRMKIVFLNRFVSALLLFLDHFQTAKDKVAEASVVAAEAAKHGMEQVYEKSTRISLNIEIQAPVIITPQNSSSTNAIVADLGTITILNEFSLGDKRNELGIPAIFEKMALDLKNLQLCRALMKPDNNEIIGQCLILEPLSFRLKIIRNHSSNWHTDHPEIRIEGRLHAVKVTLSQEDYNIMMHVLSENLTESAEDTQPTPVVPVTSTTSVTAKTLTPVAEKSVRPTAVCDIIPCKVYARFMFDFVMDSVTATLCGGEGALKPGINKRDKLFSMAEVEVKTLKAHAKIMNNSSIEAEVMLKDVVLEDTRRTRKKGIRRLMEHSPTEGTENMIFIKFEQASSGEKTVHTTVSSFTLIFCLDYIMLLGEFFSGSSAPESASKASESAVSQAKQSVTTRPAPHSVSEDSLSNSSDAMVINVKVQKPDIVLIENIEDDNSNAIFLNNEIVLRMTISGLSQSISGTVKDLTFYTACFNPDCRHETTAKILSPCDIDVQCNFREHSQHLDVMFRDLILHISPSTVQLITNILSSIVSEPVKEEEKSEKVQIDYSNLWNVKPIRGEKFWFLETVTGEDVVAEMAEDAFEVANMKQAPHQQMLFTMRKVIITIEAGVGTRTVPMLLMESSFQADIRDWATNLYVGSSFSLEISYYNEKLAVWEPLMEPIETTKGHRSWELMMELSKESESFELSPDDEESEEIVFEPPQMSIHIVAQDVLELTVSKVCLEVLTNLGQAFSEAVSKATGKEAIHSYAPYHVNNYLGIPVTIILSNGIFQILNEDNDYKCVKLESGCPPLHLTYSPSKTKSSSKMSFIKRQDAKEDIYFNIKINEGEMNVERKISVACTEKRFFQLPRTTYPGNKWGFVISIHSLYGSKFVTFHSILQVHNHFSVPIDVYYMKPNLNEVEWCCCAEPNKVENIPLHAIYTSTSELFFKPKNLDPTYSLSLPPFVWKNLIDDASTQRTVDCKDKLGAKKPFYISVAGEAERIYYEETSRKTLASSLYKLNLNPTAVLRNLLFYPVNYSIQGVDENFRLAEGESNELWAVDLGKTGLEIRLNNYLERDWSCYKILQSEVDELSVWIFESSANDKRFHLELGMHTQKVKGSLLMQLYSPFCMINKTGMLLTYRGEEDNIIYHPAILKDPVLFSFKAKAFFAKKKASLKVNDSEWSEKFSLDAVGSSGTVMTKTKDGRAYCLGVQIRMSQAGLTKMVIFTPYYLLVNNCDHDVEVKEVAENADWIKISKSEDLPAEAKVEQANNCTPFWPKDASKAEMIVRYCDDPNINTSAFSFKEVHSTLLSLKSKMGGIHVDCQIAESSVIITFEDYIPGHATALLVNHMDHFQLKFHQSNCTTEIILDPFHHILYTWENPLEQRILQWNCGVDKNEHDLIKDGIGELDPKPSDKAYWVSFLDGMQRVLMFTDDLAVATAAQEAGELERIEQEVTVSLQGVGLSLVNNDGKSEIMYMGITSTGVVWEGKKVKNKRFKPLSVKECALIEIAYQRYHNEMKVGRIPKPVVDLDGRTEINFDNMMMTKPVVRHLKRSFQTGLWLQYKTSPHQLQLHAKINRLQIDNQLMDCVFPVVLSPVAPPKSVAAENAPKPFTELSVMLRKAEHSAVPQFKYCRMLIQEFHIKLDQGFINSILLFFTAEQQTEIDHVKIMNLDKELALSSLKDVAAIYSSQDQKSYFDNLHFSPLKVHISFSMTGGTSTDDNKPTPIHSDVLNLLLQSVGVTLTEIQDVIFKLDYFERRYVFMSQKQLISEATSHYVGQSVKQLYMLVLGLDVIGNPVGLLLGLGEGVTDLFYEPFQGAIQGPEEFAEGLALGVKSLFGHAIGGAAGAASRITGTLGKGIAALTLDKEYQKKRRQNISRRPQDFTHGIAQSSKGLLMGVVEGVTGIVTKPVEGAREEGVGGFFKGFGKGLIGIVTRPTAGVVDFASGSLEAVKRVTQPSDEVRRLRVPRFIRPDGVVRPYIKREAEGNKLLQEVEKGKYADTDVYQAHVPVSDDKLFLLVTNNRVMYLEKGEIFGQWNIVWEYRFEEIKGVPTVTDKGLQILLQHPQKKGLFGQKVAGKIVHIKDPETAKWIADKLTEVMKRSA